MTAYSRTTFTALAMATTLSLTVAPAAHAERPDAGTASAQHETTYPASYPTEVDQVVAFRKAQRAQYLVDHGLFR